MLKKVPYMLPSPQLRERILARILFVKQRNARIQAGFFGLTLITSALAFVPALQFAISEVVHSAFYQYISLAFTDGGALASSWRQFGLVLIESAPVLGAILTLAVTLIFLASLRALMKRVGNIFITENSFAS